MAGQDFTVSIVGTVTGFDVAPINNLSNALRQLPSATNPAVTSGQQLSNTFNQTGTSASQLNNPLNTVKVSTAATGQQFTTTGTSARGLQQTLTPLGSGFGQVATGSNSANQALNPLQQNLQQTAVHSKTTEQASISLGEKIALMGGFITTTVGHVFGLIEGLTGLESAQVTADKAQQRVNTTLLTAEKAQDNYNKIVDKFGPSSKQAQEALANLQNKNEANRIATEKSEIANKKLQESYVSFGLEVINTVGELATMGSTISILLGKLGLKTVAMEADTAASTINVAASGEAAIAMEGEGAAASTASVGIGEAEGATAGLSVEMIAIAAPLIAAAALFVLIETNTFGMGDAFRTITPQIGSAIDVIVNGAALIYNAFIKSLEAIIQFTANSANAFIGLENAINTFLDQVVVGFTNLGQDIQNAISQVPNFFINNLINPIIGALNTFLKGMEDAWKASINAIVDFFKPAADAIVSALKTIIDAGSQIPGALGDPFRAAQKPINDAALSLKNVGTQAGQTGQQAKDAFTPIAPLANLQTTAFQHMTTSGLYPLNTAFVDVSGVIKTLDGALIQNAGNIKTGAEGFLNYYSQGQNLASGLKGAVSPAIQQVSKYIQEGTTSIMGWIVPTTKASEETDKFGGAMGKASKQTKDFATTLEESITKQNANSAAMLQSISTGQQYQKTLADLSKTLAEAIVKTADLTTKITDATAIQQRHAIAVQDGVNAFLEWGIKVQDAATQTAVFNTGLKLMTDGFFTANPLIKQTAENMKTVGAAMLGSAEDAQKAKDLIVKAFEPLGNDMAKVVDDIAGKFKDLNAKVKKPFADLPDYIRKSMTPEMKDFEISQARFKVLGEQLSGQFGVALATGGAQGALDFVQSVQDHLKNLGDKAALDPIISDLQGAIANAGTPTGNAFVQKAIAALQALGPEGATMAKQLADKFGVGIDAGLKPVPGIVQKNVTDPFTGLPTTAQAVAQKIAKAFIDLGTAFDKLPGYFLGIFTRSFVTNLVGPLGKATTSINSFINSTEVAFSNMVTTINRMLATIKPPTLAGPALPNAPIQGPSAPAPIKIPAPDLTAFLAGLARMEAAVSASASRIIQMFALVATGMNTAFQRGAGDAAGQMNLLASSVQASIANIAAAVNAIAIVFNTTFARAAQDAAGQINLLAQTVQADIANMSAAINAIAIAFNTAFTTAAQDAAGLVNQLAVTVETDIANIIAAVGAIPVAFTTNFNTAAQNAAGMMNQLAVNVQTNIQNMIAASNAFAIALTTNFNKGAQNAAGSMNALAVNEEGNIQNMIAATNAFAIAITSNFSKGASNAAGSMNSLATNVNGNVNNMVSALGRVSSMFNNIKSSIDSARSAVQSLINSINSIPTSKTVTVHIIQDITQRVHQVPVLGLGATAPTTTGPNTATVRPTGTATTTTTTLTPGIVTSPAGRRIIVELREPTIIKIDSRELIKLINKKLLELDIGALI
jgi:hypothetical protein